MAITKRMKRARMNAACCWMGSSSGGRIGRSVALSRLVRTRTQPRPRVILVLTCGDITYTLTKNSLTIESPTVRNNILVMTGIDIGPKVTFTITIVSLTDTYIEFNGDQNDTYSLSYDKQTMKPTSIITATGNVSLENQILVNQLNAVMSGVSGCLPPP
jgi:hypothetical protein